jgi:hypothetical protein
MKFRLLSASCFAALTLCAGTAHAQSLLTTQVGEVELSARITASAQGAFFQAPFAADDDTDGNLDASVRLNAEWIAANGWILGARFEYDTSDRAAEDLQRDEAYIYLSTNYGRFEVGEQDGPADVLSFSAPVVGLGQIRGDFSLYAGQGALLSPLDTSDEFKLIYLSPPIAGLRGGVSWSPDFKRNQDESRARDRTLVDNVFELGLQYQRPVGDWLLGLSGTYVTGEADPITTRADWSSWSVGVEARRGPLVIGAAYVDRGNSNRRERNFDQWELNGGVAWMEDKWGAGVSAATTQSSVRDQDTYGVGGYYTINDYVGLRADAVYFTERRPGFGSDGGFVLLAEIEFRI